MTQNRSYANIIFSPRYTRLHRDWIERGYVGEGRIVEENKNLSGIRYFGGAELSRIKLVSCNLENSDIDSSDFDEAEIIDCNWNNSDFYSNDYNRATIKNCDFVNTKFTFCKLAKAQIEGGDWSNCDYNNPYFTGAKIERVNLESSIIVEALLHKTRIRNCSFKNAYLNYSSAFFAVWENCDFRGVNFDNVQLRKTIFKNCGFYNSYGNPDALDSVQIIEPDLSADFDGSEIVEQQTIIDTWNRNSQKRLQSRKNGLIPEKSVALIVFSRKRTDAHRNWVKRGFTGEGRLVEENNNLAGFDGQIPRQLPRIRLVGCKLNNSNIQRAIFDEGEIIDCNWNNSYFCDSRFDRAQIQNCDFVEVNFGHTALREVRVEGGNWSKSNCDKTRLQKAQINGVKFRYSTFRNAKLNEAKFVNCDFLKTNFTQADATSTVFENCDFGGANMNQIKLDNATFKNCNFFGSYSDLETLESVNIINADMSYDASNSRIVEPEEVLSYWINQRKFVEEGVLVEKPDESTPEVSDEQKLEKLQQDKISDKQKLTELRLQLKQVEERIIQARKTNIFGRKQSGENERERDKLMAAIEEIKARIAQNEALISNSEEP